MSTRIDPSVSREVAVHFGTNLIRERKRAGLSQEEVGFRAALHRTEIGMLERGTRLPRIDTLTKLTGALESSPNELLDGIVWVPLVVAQLGDFRVGDRADQPAA